MSTRIDITVITRSLRQFAKQVVLNNRMAQLQKELDQRTAKEAKRKREEKVAAEVPWPGAVPEGGIRPELAAFRDSGYPVAVAYGGYAVDWPSINQGIRLWSRDGTAVLSKNLTDIPSSSRFPDELGEGESDPNWYDIRSFRRRDEFVLPAGGENLIYCFYGRTWYGSTTYLNVGDGTLTDNGGGPTGEDSFCAIVGRSSVREIAMPSALFDAMKASVRTFTWVPGRYESYPGEFGGFTFQWGGFNTLSSGSPISQKPSAETRFDPGFSVSYGAGAGIYKEFNPSALDDLPIKLSACQLEQTCTINRYGFDLSTNPDDEAPTYKRNKKGDAQIPVSLLVDDMLAAWDWGKPSYCRQQLLALGFSAADLTP